MNILVERKIPAVFVESTIPRRSVEALIAGAEARGHKVIIGGELFSDAMGAPGSYEGTYVGNDRPQRNDHRPRPRRLDAGPWPQRQTRDVGGKSLGTPRTCPPRRAPTSRRPARAQRRQSALGTQYDGGLQPQAGPVGRGIRRSGSATDRHHRAQRSRQVDLHQGLSWFGPAGLGPGRSLRQVGTAAAAVDRLRAAARQRRLGFSGIRRRGRDHGPLRHARLVPPHFQKSTATWP